ncbi:hypothetical protein GJ633_13290 [Halorubrum sp. CBA1125]|uniref:HalOD1 output domain-containing protein n=1 Tax=Halorubrum sp. CBA1125 TaxID=2668072 RepID=UPI0012E88272|nr:HalOD1 output domain-containing protein [Halorubrum sp. CBA1125]MUW15496.1 hypothetical protein [Halorubrum sp. CBA1125]
MSSATRDASESDGVTGTARVSHAPDGPTPSLAVVEAIADLAGVDSLDLLEEGVALYDHFDPDALDALVSGRSDVDVDVTVADYEVHVDAREVVVRRHRN